MKRNEFANALDALSRTPAANFSQPPFSQELYRLGVSPTALDPRGVGRPAKGEKGEMVPVAGRIDPTTKRLITKITERRVVPGVATVSDAVYAALFFWTRLLETRIREGSLTKSHARLAQLRDSYYAELEAQNVEGAAGAARNLARLALSRGDHVTATHHLLRARAIIYDLEPQVAERFKEHIYGEKGKDALGNWSTDPVAMLWDEVLGGKWDHLEAVLDLNGEQAEGWDTPEEAA